MEIPKQESYNPQTLSPTVQLVCCLCSGSPPEGGVAVFTTDTARPATVDDTAGKKRNAAAVPPNNIPVAYEEVVLTEEDAELLRQIREDPSSLVGRPVRPPRGMADG
jgi:hypothetical protein